MDLYLNRSDFKNFLKGISLNGIIKEIAFEIKDQKVNVKCIDELSVLFLKASMECVNEIEKVISFGFKDIQLLQKVISDLLLEEKIKFTVKNNVLKVGNNKISFSLLETQQVNTYFKNEKKLNELLNKYTDFISIDLFELNELKKYLSIFNPVKLKLSVKDNSFNIENADTTSYNKFDLKICDCDNLEDIEISISSKYFSSILNYMLDSSEEQMEKVNFSILNGMPFFISFENFDWLLSPM